MARQHPRLATLSLVLGALAATSAFAAGDEKPFDLASFDGKAGSPKDGRIDAREARIAGLHRTNANLAKYDKDYSGDLSDEELKLLQADVSAGPSEPEDLAMIATMINSAGQAGGTPIEKIDKAEALACAVKSRFYVRRDEIDLSAYTNTVSKKEAKGASLAMSLEEVSDIDRTEAHGIVSWVRTQCLHRPKNRASTSAYLSSWSFAPFLAPDGVRSDDPDEDKSSLKAGASVQLTFSGGRLFDLQAFALKPYYQTDFRGAARASGAAASWDPYNLDLKLGGAYRPLFGEVYGYWQFRLDADWLHVDKPGRTDLEANTDYAWLGGTIGATVFPVMPKGWRHRWKLYGSIELHRDVNNDTEARLTTIGTGINLDADGDIALSLERAWGEDRETRDQIRKTSLSLDFKY
jgi:hypothetical protein